MARHESLTVTELQRQIASVEGFQISFDRFDVANVDIPPYPFDIMAPSKWRLSDWKRIRLAPYVLIFKGIRVYRGDESLVNSDLKLVTLRDSYYETRYGTLEPIDQPALHVVHAKGSGEKRDDRSS